MIPPPTNRRPTLGPPHCAHFRRAPGGDPWAPALAHPPGTLKALDPDISLISTGDMVDSSAVHLEGSAASFAAIHPVTASTRHGNHEQYRGLDMSLAFTSRRASRPLQGEAVEVLPGLLIAGVDDPGRVGPGVMSPGAVTPRTTVPCSRACPPASS